jgi:hypothetical protein
MTQGWRPHAAWEYSEQDKSSPAAGGAVPQPDVESEIYEHLYGLPRRDRRNGEPTERKIVIADAPPAPDHGDLEPLAVSHAPVRHTHAPHLDLGHLVGAAGELLGAIAVRLRRATADLRPAGDAVIAAARRHPAPATALVWALLAAPVVALALPSGGAGAVSTRLQPGAPAHFALPASPAPRVPAPAPHRPPARRTTTAQETSTGAAVNPLPLTTAGTRRRSTSAPARRKPTTPRRHRTVTAPHRAPSVRRPSSNQEPRPTSGVTPSPPQTTTTTPTTPGGTGTTTAPTGGQPAPTG